MRYDRRHRFVACAYVLALSTIFAVGCSTREDPSEELIVCGNHSCGELTMVTIDTNGPGGYQYLDAVVSPDGTRIAFTADWAVIPSIPPEEVGDPILARQILVMPVPGNMPMPGILWQDTMSARNPVSSIQSLGAQLIRFQPFVSQIGGGEELVDFPDQLANGSPNWIDNNTLLLRSRFERADRLVKADITDPEVVVPVPLYYEDDDLLEAGSWFWYHHDPSLSPDGRWCLFTRFGCDDAPNADSIDPDVIVTCTDEELWVLDMETTDDPANAVAFPLTSGAGLMEDPTWSPDGLAICFSATTDLVGDSGSLVGELFRIRFDPALAETGVAPLNLELDRITTTEVSGGDPLTGLHNQAPVFTPDGNSIVFVSSRRAPGSTQRGRNLWMVTADGRLEPEMIFYSRFDEVGPTFHWPSGTLLFSSRMGFPTEALNALERETIEHLTAVANDSDTSIPMTSVEIERRAADEREDLELFGGKMAHMYVFRGY